MVGETVHGKYRKHSTLRSLARFGVSMISSVEPVKVR